MNIKVADKPYRFLQANRDKRFVYMYGGAGSAKSWSLDQYLILEILSKEKNIGILALRKTKPAVKTSCLTLTKYWLDKMDVPYSENKTEMTITVGSNFIHFDSIDDVEKKKSIEGINYIWLEECTEFAKKDVMQLNLRCRAANENGINQLFFTFNPIDPIGNAWLKHLSDTAGTHTAKHTGLKDSCVLSLVHGDNPFLSDQERAQIEELAEQDAEYDKIYRLGQWATPTNIIYERWDIVDSMPEQFDDTYWGLDFGYSTNPSALAELRFAGNELYERERLYEKGLTNPDLIIKLEEIIENKSQMIIADCAEPKTIQEIRNAGFNIIPCKKGKDSVRFGIAGVRSFNQHIEKESSNLIEEISGYKWKTDKDENVLPEPVKFKDHFMDAIRYAVMHVKNTIMSDILIVEPEADEYDDEDMWENW